MKLHPDVKRLLDEINAFRSRTGMERTRFGIEAVNDGHLLPRLQSGREPRRATVERVRAFMKRKAR